MNGTYEEKLSFNSGKLKVTKNNWEIYYYFSGPDLRYNGILFSISGTSIDLYIKAYIKNFDEFNKLKEVIPRDGDFSIKGELNMDIRVGKYFQGVCITSYHMPISTQSELDKLIKDFNYAKDKAPKIQEFLKLL